MRNAENCFYVYARARVGSFLMFVVQAEHLQPEFLQRLFARLQDSQIGSKAGQEHCHPRKRSRAVRNVPQEIVDTLLAQANQHEDRDLLLAAHNSEEDFEAPTAVNAFGGAFARDEYVSMQASLLEDVILTHASEIRAVPNDLLAKISNMVGLDTVVKPVGRSREGTEGDYNHLLLALQNIRPEGGFVSEDLLLRIVNHGGSDFVTLRGAKTRSRTLLHILLQASSAQDLNAVILRVLEIGGMSVVCGLHVEQNLHHEPFGQFGGTSLPLFHSAATNAEHISTAVLLKLIEIGGAELLHEKHNSSSGFAYAIQHAEHISSEVLVAVVECADDRVDTGDLLFEALQQAEHVDSSLLVKLVARCKKHDIIRVYKNEPRRNDGFALHHHHQGQLRQPDSIFVAALMSAAHISDKDVFSKLLAKGGVEALFAWSNTAGNGNGNARAFHSPMYRMFEHAEHLPSKFLEHVVDLCPRSLLVHQRHHLETETPLHSALENFRHVSTPLLFKLIQRGGLQPAHLALDGMFNRQFESDTERHTMARVFVKLVDSFKGATNATNILGKVFTDEEYGTAVRQTLHFGWTAVDHSWRSTTCTHNFVLTVLLAGQKLEDRANLVPIDGPATPCLSPELWAYILQFLNYTDMNSVELLADQLIGSLSYVHRKSERARSPRPHSDLFSCHGNGCTHRRQFDKAGDSQARFQLHWRCCGDLDSSSVCCLQDTSSPTIPLTMEAKKNREVQQLGLIDRGGRDVVLYQTFQGLSTLTVAFDALERQAGITAELDSKESLIVSDRVLARLIEVS